jgi:hypothetical protein
MCPFFLVAITQAIATETVADTAIVGIEKAAVRGDC